MTPWSFPGSDIFENSIGLILLSVLSVVIAVLWYKKNQKNIPPGPYGLPIVGYLPYLGNDSFITLHELSKKYGKVFSVNYGTNLVVVTSEIESFREAINKTELLDRPPGIFAKVPGSGGFTGANGNLWAEQRKFTMKTVRNIGVGKSAWEMAIADEVNFFIKHLQNLEGKPVDIEKSLTASVARTILSLVVSKPIEESSPVSELITEFIKSVMKVVSIGVLSYYFPSYLRWLVIRNIPISEKDYEIIHQYDNYIRKEIKERKKDTSYTDSCDFIGSYLEEIRKKEDSGDKAGNYNEHNLIGNMTSMIVGGSETTKTSIQWTFVAMAQRPDIQQKVYEELEKVLGEKSLPQWEERTKLPLTYACIMEAQRWRTLSPISLMRLAKEDISIGGYDVVRGTAVIGNLWAVHNDEKYWKNPETFDPYRFIKSDGTVNVKPESYVPFSLGRRNCPGDIIALMEIMIYFCAVVRNFEIKPEGTAEEFNVQGVTGQTYQPQPHKLRFSPRH